MGWSIGYDDDRKRDIGYGVPATCDHPGCTAEIDRGLGYVCGGEPFGGEHGCGLFVCGEHQRANANCSQLCQHCADRRRKKLSPSPDRPEWIDWKLTDESWQQWRDENPDEVAKLRAAQLDGGQEGTLARCAAGRDGECGHKACPQLRDKEPAKSGRHCPLDQEGIESNG